MRPVDATGAFSDLSVSARRCPNFSDTDASSAVGFDVEVEATDASLSDQIAITVTTVSAPSAFALLPTCATAFGAAAAVASAGSPRRNFRKLDERLIKAIPNSVHR